MEASRIQTPSIFGNWRALRHDSKAVRITSAAQTFLSIVWRGAVTTQSRRHARRSVDWVTFGTNRLCQDLRDAVLAHARSLLGAIKRGPPSLSDTARDCLDAGSLRDCTPICRTCVQRFIRTGAVARSRARSTGSGTSSASGLVAPGINLMRVRVLPPHLTLDIRSAPDPTFARSRYVRGSTPIDLGLVSMVTV